MATHYKPALLVVDMQEDFCPPKGSLAVPQGRDVADPINALLALPFPLRIATRDWHPPSHVSFASNHDGAAPFSSTHTLTNPGIASTHSSSSSSSSSPAPPPVPDSYTIPLWPDHCVAHTPGAALISELDAARLTDVVDKGQDPRYEMYSAFYDPFRRVDSGLASRLREEHVTHVFVVGLAADFCVKATAEHARAEGYETYVVQEATRPVGVEAWEQCRKGVEAAGVRFVSINGEEVARVRTYTPAA